MRVGVQKEETDIQEKETEAQQEDDTQQKQKKDTFAVTNQLYTQLTAHTLTWYILRFHYFFARVD